MKTHREVMLQGPEALKFLSCVWDIRTPTSIIPIEDFAHFYGIHSVVVKMND
jgi:hypothetical protein